MLTKVSVSNIYWGFGTAPVHIMPGILYQELYDNNSVGRMATTKRPVGACYNVTKHNDANVTYVSDAIYQCGVKSPSIATVFNQVSSLFVYQFAQMSCDMATLKYMS